MIFIADKYLIEPLKKLARDKFDDRLHTEWSQPSFGEAILQIYDNESPSVLALKQVLLSTVGQHSNVLWNDPAYSAFRQSALGSPEFLLDLCKDNATVIHGQKDIPMQGNVTWYKCPGAKCSKYDAVFCVSKTVPDWWHFNFPLRCSGEQNRAYWREHLLKRSA